MANKIINLLEYRDMSRKSNDGIWTQGRLMDKILSLVHRVNTTNDSDNDISEFIKTHLQSMEYWIHTISLDTMTGNK